LEDFVEEADEEDDDSNKEEEASEDDSEEEEIQVGKGLSMDIIMAAIPRKYRYRVMAILYTLYKGL
jgi:hypothetical protein